MTLAMPTSRISRNAAALRILVAAAVSLIAAPALAAVVEVAPAGAATVALTVHDFEFLPPTLTVPVGTTVRVTNTGSAGHTWSSDPGDAQSWDSGVINPGGTFSVTFNQAGSFGYHCNIHTFMTGTIVVTAAPVTTTTAPQTTSTAGNGTTSPQATTPTSGLAGITGPGAPTPPAVDPTALPRTGAVNTGRLVAVAATLTLLGLAFVGSSRRRRRA